MMQIILKVGYIILLVIILLQHACRLMLLHKIFYNTHINIIPTAASTVAAHDNILPSEGLCLRTIHDITHTDIAAIIIINLTFALIEIMY
jgi:hypothetical protein